MSCEAENRVYVKGTVFFVCFLGKLFLIWKRTDILQRKLSPERYKQFMRWSGGAFLVALLKQGADTDSG